MKKLTLLTISLLVLALLCSCGEKTTEFKSGDLSLSYPESWTTTEVENYLLSCSADEDGARVFYITAQSADELGREDITEEFLKAVCEASISRTMPEYQQAVAQYGLNIDKNDFSYTIDPITEKSFGSRDGIITGYRIEYNNKQIGSTSMDFCQVIIFEEDICYLITFYDLTGGDARDSFADCIESISCG